MLALETTDDWAFSVDIDIGGAETYTNAEADAVASITALVAWANNAARGWFGFTVFAWDWARDSFGGARLQLLGAGFAFDITAGAHDRLGLPSDAAVSEVTGDQAATGTWAPISQISLQRNIRLLDDGDACGDGAVRPGVPALAHRLPKLDAVGTAYDAARLAAVLAAASSPRRIQVWQLHTASWVALALGSVSRSSEGKTLYRFALETAGDVV